MKSWAKKAEELAKKIVRENAIECAKCSKRKEHCQLHGSHILSVGSCNGLRADLDNIIPLCASCHKLAGDSWHQSPLENWEWFQSMYPERFNKLMKKKKKIKPIKEYQWKEIYNQLKQREKKYYG